MIIGYARVSTEEQRLDAQINTLNEAHAERIFSDKISGTKRTRPELDKLLEQLRDDDVVLVTKYDRLARSLPDLLDIVATVESKGAGFRSLAEDIDTTTPAGRLIFHVFASIAQFERERIRERTMEGLKTARTKGRIGGRPVSLTDDQKAEVLKLKEERRSVKDIAALFNVSVSTVKRVR
jgi:DNA invertase Pin-like site-specific DNA recombinase